jgi:hypothetical protein
MVDMGVCSRVGENKIDFFIDSGDRLPDRVDVLSSSLKFAVWKVAEENAIFAHP